MIEGFALIRQQNEAAAQGDHDQKHMPDCTFKMKTHTVVTCVYLVVCVPCCECTLLCVYLVVDVTVGEHGVEVLHGLTGAPVIIVLQTFLDGSHVHRVLDHLVVVLETWTCLA